MRAACILAHERGVTLCCPVHDALLAESPIDEIEEVSAALGQARLSPV